MRIGSSSVLLMDLHMPVMGGIEATHRIRDTVPEHLQPTIVAVTGSDSAEESMSCLYLGIGMQHLKADDTCNQLRSVRCFAR